jgi:hypothetical protein
LRNLLEIAFLFFFFRPEAIKLFHLPAMMFVNQKRRTKPIGKRESTIVRSFLPYTFFFFNQFGVKLSFSLIVFTVRLLSLLLTASCVYNTKTTYFRSWRGMNEEVNKNKTDLALR